MSSFQKSMIPLNYVKSFSQLLSLIFYLWPIFSSDCTIPDAAQFFCSSFNFSVVLYNYMPRSPALLAFIVFVFIVRVPVCLVTIPLVDFFGFSVGLLSVRSSSSYRCLKHFPILFIDSWVLVTVFHRTPNIVFWSGIEIIVWFIPIWALELCRSYCTRYLIIADYN